jgi:hypothetical protein
MAPFAIPVALVRSDAATISSKLTAVRLCLIVQQQRGVLTVRGDLLLTQRSQLGRLDQPRLTLYDVPLGLAAQVGSSGDRARPGRVMARKSGIYGVDVRGLVGRRLGGLLSYQLRCST